MTTVALGIDIGASKISAAVVTETGEIRRRAQCRTPAHGSDVVPAIFELVSEVGLDGTVRAVGVGAAGIIDPMSGIVTGATSNLPGWEGVRLRDDLGAILNLPTTVINDVHAHAWGEMHFGAGIGHKSAFVVAVGTGIGGVLVTEDGIDLGVHGASGHFGHILSVEAALDTCTCGQKGHLESVASGRGIPALYHRLGGTDGHLTTREIFEQYGIDAIATNTVEVAASALGHSIGSAVNLLDPGIIVLAGGMRNPGGPWIELVKRGVLDVAMPSLSEIQLVVTPLGANAALIGASNYALSRGRQNES